MGDKSLLAEFQVAGHESSWLPAGKKWILAWSDEFDGTELDRNKWGFRLNFWGTRLKTFTTEGVELDGKSHLRLNLVRKGDDFYSPHLQTGSLSYDIPKDSNGWWPFGTKETPRFMHRYGYYECRCRQPKNPGWHSAFWLQSPSVGAHPDPKRAGIECDIMENHKQFSHGVIVCGNIWNGYGLDGKSSGHAWVPYEETADGWHLYACDWHRGGYDFYFDKKLVCRIVPTEEERQQIIASGQLPEDRVKAGPVSDVEQFILLSTECHGYRGPGFSAPVGHPKGTPVPLLFDAKLPDYFEVDYVRVFDEV